MGDPIIRFQNVTKKYQLGMVEINALHNVDIEIERGAFISLMGPSGSGKSTLLNLIGGLDSPTSGEIFIDGINITNMNEKDLAEIRRDKIGFVFQFFNLIPTFTALENVELPMIFQDKLLRSEIRERAKDLLELVDLGERLQHRPTQLSGGQQQRVAIARALANDPVIVLADEPTGNIDSVTGSQIIQLMGLLNKMREQTFLIVTHDHKVSDLTQYTLYMIDGRISKDPEDPQRVPPGITATMEKEFLASELRFLRKSLENIQKNKGDLKPEIYRQILSEYSDRIKRLRSMIEG